MSEYTNSAAGSSACSYAPLGQYNASYSMNNVPFQGKVTTGNYIVPSWGAIGYDALTNQTPSCSGYFDIQAAYGADAGNCQTDYTSAACGAGGDQAPTQQLGALVRRPAQQQRM
jgi:hypothetical protein